MARPAGAISGGEPSRAHTFPRVALGLALLLGLPCCRGSGAQYVGVAARRGDLVVTVAAKGSLEALNQATVTAEVGGDVTDVYVRAGDSVESGQPLCRIDPEHWQLLVSRAEAQLATNEAALTSAQRARQAAEAALERAERRAAKNAKATGELDALRGALEKARADEQVESSLVTVATTELDTARTALDHTLIRSPMSGVVVSRSVEPGQTLATSTAAPVVFVLARDLRRMELRAFVDEADIGQLAVGQAATFAVDTLADRRFSARLSSIRNIPLRQAHRVGFEARLEVENGDGLLRPGLVANVSITTAERKDSVLIPNAALRFAPEQVLLRERRAAGNVLARPSLDAAEPEGQRTVWVITGDDEPRARRVAVGLSDSSWTEALGGAVAAGEQIAVDVRVSRN